MSTAYILRTLPSSPPTLLIDPLAHTGQHAFTEDILIYGACAHSGTSCVSPQLNITAPS